MNKFIIWSAVLILFFSCKQRGQDLISQSTKMKVLKNSFLDSYASNGLNIEALKRLKSYSDGFMTFSSSLQQFLKSKNGRKSLNKYLSELEHKETLCRSFLLPNTLFQEVRKACSIGHFDVCPLTFNKYSREKELLLRVLNESVDKEVFRKTDCGEFARGIEDEL